MNTNQGALYFGAGIDLNQWRRDIDTMRRDIAGLSQNTQRETSNMDSSFRNLSIGIAGYFSVSAIKGFVTELINVRGEFQKTEIAYATMLGSVDKAKSLMGDMVDLAAKTPFSLQDVTDGAKRLLAFQVPAGQVLDTLTRLGNVSAGLSVPISRLILVYGQVMAKGRLMGDDLRQFTEAGIPMVAELAKKFGKTTAEISDMVSAGKIGFKDVQEVLFSMTNEGGMFFNLMEKQSKSLSGQVANLGDSWDQMLNKIGESQQGVLTGGIQGLAYLIDHYEDVVKILTVLISTYGAYRAALILTSVIQKSLAFAQQYNAAMQLARGISGMTRAQILFNIASSANPWGAIAAIIGLVVSSFVLYGDELKKIIGITKELNASQKAQEAITESYNSTFAKGVASTKAGISELISVIKNESSSLDQREDAYKKLIAVDPAFRGTLDAQFQATYKLGDALQFVIGKIDAFAMAQAKAAASRKFLEESFEEQFKAGALKTQVLDADAEAKKWRKLDAEARKNGKASLDYMNKAYDAEKKRDKLASEWRKQQDVSNQKSSISNTIIKNNSAEISQKEKQLSLIEKEIKLGKLSGESLELKKKQADRIRYELSGFKPTTEAVIPESPQATEKAKKKKEKHERELAEVYSLNSIADLEERISLWNEALQKSSGDKVLELDKNKYGDTVKTGKVVSVSSALAEVQKLEEAKAKRQKEIEVRSFEERITEAERQWNNYYKMAEFYGKESADAQYKELFKGSSNYLQYLEQQEQALKDLADTGVISDQQKTDLLFLSEKIRGLNGTETPFENFKKGIDNALKSLPSLVDQLELVEKTSDDAFTKAGTNNNPYLQERKYLEERKREILQQQKDIYQEFLKEQETFEQKSDEIKKKYDNIRAQIGQNKSLSDPERLRLLDSVAKNEAQEYSNAYLEMFKKTKLWEKIFGNLEGISKKEILKLIPIVKKQIEELIRLDAPIDEIERYKQKLEELETFTSGKSPVEKLVASFKKLKLESKDADGKIDWSNFAENYGDFADALKLAVGTALELGDALGFISDTDGMQQTLDNLMETTKGLVSAISGYVDGDYAQMAGGILQMATGMAKMLNGDDDKNFIIRSWERSVNDLKTAYEQLNRELDKTAGSAQFDVQKELAENLQKQKAALESILKLEKEKKKPDSTKVNEYQNQIAQINGQLEDLVDSFLGSIAQTNFKDVASQLADALTDAFGKGEDAALAYEKVVDDVMRNAVKNALKIAILEPATKKIVDQLVSSMGYGSSSGSQSAMAKQIKDAEDLLYSYEKESSDLFANGQQNSFRFQELSPLIKELRAKIDALKTQAITDQNTGSFDGLTQEERDAVKAQGTDAMNQYMAALKQYEDLFGAASENAQGLKGDIKGITEKTAGALEAQFNAVRINIVAIFQLAKQNHTVQNAHTVLLSQIEVNTRRLHSIDKSLIELNTKVKKSLAGFP